MSRMMIYVAHPIGGDVENNISNVKRWIRWLMIGEPSVCFVAPYVTSIEAGASDGDPIQRRRGMLDNFAVLDRSDGIALVGGRLSIGMNEELAYAQTLNAGWTSRYPEALRERLSRVRVYDLIPLGFTPPEQPGSIWAYERPT
jgi:hypothetical protein